MRRMLAACFAVILSCAVASAEDQKIEYGDVSELRGVKVIFIDSGLNLKFRENAVEALKKELPSVRVGKEEEADVTLQVETRGSDTKQGDDADFANGCRRPNVPRVHPRGRSREISTRSVQTF